MKRKHIDVYPTVAEGAFAMTNEIVSAVLKVSDGKATFDPLRFHGGKYGEMKFCGRRHPCRLHRTGRCKMKSLCFEIVKSA